MCIANSESSDYRKDGMSNGLSTALEKTRLLFGIRLILRFIDCCQHFHPLFSCAINAGEPE